MCLSRLVELFAVGGELPNDSRHKGGKADRPSRSARGAVVPMKAPSYKRMKSDPGTSGWCRSSCSGPSRCTVVVTRFAFQLACRAGRLRRWFSYNLVSWRKCTPSAESKCCPFAVPLPPCHAYPHHQIHPRRRLHQYRSQLCSHPLRFRVASRAASACSCRSFGGQVTGTGRFVLSGSTASRSSRQFT